MGNEITTSDRPGIGGRLTGLDLKLLEFARKRFTGEQMSEELSGVLSPARCVQRLREIVSSQNLISANDQKALLLLDLVKVRDLLFEIVEGGETHIDRWGNVQDVSANPQQYANLIRLLTEWRKTIESMQTDVDTERMAIRAFQGRLMVEAVESVMTEYNRQLAALGYAIPREVAMSAMEDALPAAWSTIGPKVEDEVA